ncbi:C-type lectin domain family 2 member D isoform X2 [Chelonia mydas]|uniref:C-type lectin domain family 2 member D isoform X2 n=1 Tax=Chelonia mydas TaxID=8469 RepID=UPI001CA8C084|nr:C-type lectin domain family 2 member D isoform X2 [Chelonia mydas]
MGPAAGPAGSEEPLQEWPVEGNGHLETGREPEPRCNCKKHRVTLAFVFLILIIIVLAVLQFTSSLDARATFAVPSLGPPFVPSQDPPFVPCCPERWVGYRGKCYYFSKEKKNWDSSQHFCSWFSASLAVIDTQQEKDFMMNYAGPVEHWIGLRRESSQPWKWVNGTIFNQQLFEVRAEGDCAYLSDVFVSSSRCYSLRNWICSKPNAYTKEKEHAMEGD